jgi:hypothetical protein
MAFRAIFSIDSSGVKAAWHGQILVRAAPPAGTPKPQKGRA